MVLQKEGAGGGMVPTPQEVRCAQITCVGGVCAYVCEGHYDTWRVTQSQQLKVLGVRQALVG